MYHYVRPMPDPDFPYLKACALDRFIKQLDYLQENYRVVSWPDAHAYLTGKASLPERACLLTFDDGLRDCFLHVYPLLRARGISGLFFPMARRSEEGLAAVQTLQLVANRYSDPAEFREMIFAKLSPPEGTAFEGYCRRVEDESPPDRFGEVALRTMRRVINTYMFRELGPVLDEICRERIGEPKELGRAFYLGDADVREMATGGMYFGGHGVTHHRMTRLTEEELRKELRASREYLATYAKEPFAFSYPYGDYNDSVMEAVERAGFVCAFADRSEGLAPYINFGNSIMAAVGGSRSCITGLAGSRFALPRVDTIHVPPRG